jgi:hypothetical protein
MMRTSLMARLLLVVGVLIFLTSAAADPLGIGGAAGVGWKQITGMIVGVAVAAIGIRRLQAARG